VLAEEDVTHGATAKITLICRHDDTRPRGAGTAAVGISRCRGDLELLIAIMRNYL